ncbi:MAG TPA: bifunctional aspartate kinase/homoserine dehydrogenase I [Saprospiraceae bacterium]|nr:bifunctional aspartate kinase/homoserine dehydrogenase I [Saprospiraceae bacterium]
MKILKFGGSSVATPERINEVIQIVKPRLDTGERLSLVFSAFGGITDLLVEMSQLASEAKDRYIALYHQFCDLHMKAARDLLGGDSFYAVENDLASNHKTLKELLRGIYLVREVSPRTLDYVLSFGERNACFIISAAFREKGILARYIDARKVIITNKEFGNAKVNFHVTEQKIKDCFDSNNDELLVVTGFIGADIGGLTTTLGRGGSDYTASILASSIQAECLEIWTDVDGVLTSDPRKVKKAFSVPQLSYNEAMELSHFGAKVIYPPTIQPALNKGIPIYIKNTLNPSHPGTLISNIDDRSWSSPLKGISSLSNISLLSLEGSAMMGVHGTSARLFTALASKEINVVLITQASSEHSICIAVDQKDANKARKALEWAFEPEIQSKRLKPVRVENDLCIIAIIGENMRAVPGVAGKLFQALGRNGINVVAIAQGSSERNISFVVHRKEESKALNLIHDAFFLSDTRTFHLFIAGVGLIGSTLLDQINDQKDELKIRYGIAFEVVALANSKKMLFDENGIDLNRWKILLNETRDINDPIAFIEKMNVLNLSNSIFLDNTAQPVWPGLYHRILANNISIITPNKVAPSSSFERYVTLKEIARSKGVFFLYETNVGAGLPILSTIKNLVNSGDKILRIQAVVSGSLSYIFNHFNGSTPFSVLVKEARAKGYTEPDPREDLSGMDVKRKIIILAREAGFPLEESDVELIPILKEKWMDKGDIDDFFIGLAEYDQELEKRINELNQVGKRLRFIANTSNGHARVSLEEVDHQSPFFNLSGADNLFVITTQRYKERPLVIRGPGAGAEVTAAGVFADLLTIANIA